jgi:hypothetical protein
MLLLILTMCLVALPANAKYSGGTGEPNDPYQIATAADLISLGSTPADQGKHFVMQKDIDLAGRTWLGAAIPSFSGTFDGNGLAIHNLTIQSHHFLALFGRLDKGAKVRNLGLLDVNIVGDQDVMGALAGCNDGSVTNCYSSGVISALLQGGQGGIVGGLVGLNRGSVSDCFSRCKVSGTSFVAGLVGYNLGTVHRCYSAGTVDCRLANEGGLAGENLPEAVVGENPGKVTASFYDLSGISEAGLLFNRSDLLPTAGARAMSTAQMKDIKIYLDAGWDFVGESKNGTDDTWTMGEGGYPCLSFARPKHDMNSTVPSRSPSDEDAETVKKWVDVTLAAGYSLSLSQAPGHYDISDRLKELVAASQIASSFISAGVWVTVLDGGVAAKVGQDWVVPIQIEGGNVPKLEFRNGRVGLLKGEAYVEDGTELRVNGGVWTYRQGAWHQQTESTSKAGPMPPPVSSQNPDMEARRAAAVAEMSAWNDAESQDTVEAYQSLLATYPNGVYAAEARMRIEEIKDNDAERLAELKRIGNEPAALLQFIQKHPQGTRRSAAILARQRLEDLVVESIRRNGPQDRFVIREIMPAAGESVGSCTVERLDGGAVVLGFEYPKDAIPFDTRRGGLGMVPAGAGSVIRFRGAYGDFMGYRIDGDTKEPIAFVLLDKTGMVYVAGKGKVTLKNGTVVTLPSNTSSQSLR